MNQKTVLFKRCLALILIMALNISLMPMADVSAKKTKNNVNMKAKTVTGYTISAKAHSNEKVYFNGSSDIPYVDLDKEFEIVTGLLKMIYGVNDSFKTKKSANKLIWTRTNGAVSFDVVFDFDKNTVYFADVNGFFRQANSSLVGVEGNQGMMHLLQEGESNYNRYGKSVSINLNKYGIKLLKQGKKMYIPLQTFSDLFMSRLQFATLYNGQSVIYLLEGGIPDDLKEVYYKVKPKKMSKAYAAYNYGELCLALDQLYGLKSTHDIKTFDSFFTETGLGLMIKSQDALGTDAALLTAIKLYFDDMHCGYRDRSYRTDNESLEKYKEQLFDGAYRSKFYALMDELKEARAKYYPNDPVPYEEKGDTAYITFDDFATDSSQDHTVLPTDAELSSLGKDSVRLIQYAVGKITRKDSPIKQVVLDLSNNGGGSIFDGCYLLAAFLGNSAVAIKDMSTGATSMASYKADTNLDGEFNADDTLAGRGLKLYCITSGVTYSCANMVATVFKDSGKVTLIGRTSGGGSCCVQPLSTASGTLFRISGPYRFSFSKNGGFYDNDRGADPDVYVEDLGRLYDRAYVNKLIDSIN